MAQSKNEQNLASQTFKGALWLSALRWFVRFVGLISISITARVLTPEDFGVYSSVAILSGLFVMLQYGGIQDYLVSQKTISRDMVNSAWTVRLMLSSSVCIILLCLAPISDTLLNEARVPAVMAVYAFVPLADAFVHPKIITLLRDMKYADLFRIRLTERFLVTGITLAFVLTLQTYWGIVIGALVGAVTFALFSHIYFGFGAALNTSGIKNISRYSAVFFGRTLSNYATDMSDSFAARHMVGTDIFSGYHNGKELSRNLISDIAQPIGMALFPAMSKLRGEPKRFANAANRGFGAICLFAALLSGGLHLTAEEAIAILLGDQWGFAVPYIKLSAFLIGISTVYNTLNYIFLSIDRQGTLTILMAIRAVVVVASSIGLYLVGELEALLYGMIAVFGGFLILHGIVLSRLAQLGPDLLIAAFRPIVSAVVMVLLTPVLFGLIPGGDVFVVIAAVCKALIAGSLFLLTLSVLWILFGRPRGPETALLERLGINEERVCGPIRQS